ncbi:deoxyguanosinetriphosphate triphosphohydrolase [Lutibacter sp.]|uniref:deoxyguanosinetriphosphate triphosphohydrolase n=1 Tax=Lutibacter sp. TaxID=1925666 RepID=UPI0035627168
MNWIQLLSLKRFGDTQHRARKDQDETRLGFEVDYDRIIFSDSFRSLQDKTQVVPLSKTDFVHTRLTHSLEVSVVARSLGRTVGEKVLKKHPELVEEGYKMNDFGAIVATAALAHDIGNPPFGHSGEKAIGEYFKNGNGIKFKEFLSKKQWQDIIDFEGNANGFRLLTESKNGSEGGLRLSFATLGAFMKYPKESLPKKPTSHIADKKYGVFQSEVPFFKEVATDLGLISSGNNEDISYRRHPLAYLVEAADDICYTIIDFEDGINLGVIEEDFALEYLIKLVKDTIDSKKYHQLEFKKDRLSYLRALAIGTLISEASDVFLKNEDAILKGEYPFSLLDKCKYEAQINDIIKLSVEKIYRSREVIEKELVGYNVIGKLLDVFITSINNSYENTLTNYDRLVLNLLPESLQKPKETMYLRILSICGFVASLTDGYALQLYKKLNG